MRVRSAAQASAIGTSGSCRQNTTAWAGLPRGCVPTRRGVNSCQAGPPPWTAPRPECAHPGVMHARESQDLQAEIDRWVRGVHTRRCHSGGQAPISSARALNRWSASAVQGGRQGFFQKPSISWGAGGLEIGTVLTSADCTASGLSISPRDQTCHGDCSC